MYRSCMCIQYVGTHHTTTATTTETETETTTDDGR